MDGSKKSLTKAAWSGGSHYESREPRAREPRAREPRAESREPRAESSRLRTVWPASSSPPRPNNPASHSVRQTFRTAPPEQPSPAHHSSNLPNCPARRTGWCGAMRRKHHRRYQGRFTRLARLSRCLTAPSAAGLPLTLATLLVITTPQGNAQEPCPGGGYDPAPTAVAVEAVPIVVESTTEEYFVLYVKHDLDGTDVELPVLVKLGEAGRDHAGRKHRGAARGALPGGEVPRRGPGRRGRRLHRRRHRTQ